MVMQVTTLGHGMEKKQQLVIVLADALKIALSAYGMCRVHAMSSDANSRRTQHCRKHKNSHADDMRTRSGLHMCLSGKSFALPWRGFDGRSYWVPGSYVTRNSMSAGSNALPRLRTLGTHSKKPKYGGSFSCEMPRRG